MTDNSTKYYQAELNIEQSAKKKDKELMIEWVISGSDVSPTIGREQKEVKQDQWAV